MPSHTSIASILAAGALISVAASASAGAHPLDQFPAEPIDGAGIDCGSVPQINDEMRFWNYDADFTSCADAVGILNTFLGVRERSATIGAWNCGINGAAEQDRTGILIACVGPRGPLHALQVESPL